MIKQLKHLKVKLKNVNIIGTNLFNILDYGISEFWYFYLYGCLQCTDKGIIWNQTCKLILFNVKLILDKFLDILYVLLHFVLPQRHFLAPFS